MKTLVLTSLTVVLFLATGCKPKQAETDAVIRIPFESAKTIDLGQYIEGVHYVQLENHPESAFTDLDKLMVCGDRIFMLDKRLEAVFCFDTTGSFKYRIQRVGQGPGEYIELDAMWVKPHEKELWLQSFWPSKIMVYDLNGQFLREFDIRWSARDMVAIGENLIIGYNASRSNDGTDSIQEGTFLLNEKGEFLNQPYILGDSSMYWSIGYQRNLEEYNPGVLLISQSDTIFHIDQTGKVTPDMLMDWGKLKFPDEYKGVSKYAPRNNELFGKNYVFSKDQLIAFGPIRMFRVIIGSHLELALADLQAQQGTHSTQVSSNTGKMPLLFPIAKSDQNELIGIYDMSTLLAMKESMDHRTEDPTNQQMFQEMDSMIESAFKQDRPILWVAKIKQTWLTKKN